MLQQLAARARGPTRRRRPTPVRPSALRRRRKDPLSCRAPAGAVGRARHDRLQLPERPERRLRGRLPGTAHAARVREAHRPWRLVRRRAVCGEAADHDDRDGERAERARAHAGPHRREQPQVARLHARQPARRDHRGRRLLPRVSHLRGRDRLARGRPADPLPGDCARAPAQSGDGVDDLRFLPRGRAAARRARRQEPRRRAVRNGAADTRRRMPTKRASGCASA